MCGRGWPCSPSWELEWWCFSSSLRFLLGESPARANDYIARFGRSSWELDAIEPVALATLVRDAILGLRDDDKWEESTAREDRAKVTLENAAEMIEDGTIG
jgi:hypothetical protein